MSSLDCNHDQATEQGHKIQPELISFSAVEATDTWVSSIPPWMGC